MRVQYPPARLVELSVVASVASDGVHGGWRQHNLGFGSTEPGRCDYVAGGYLVRVGLCRRCGWFSTKMRAGSAKFGLGDPQRGKRNGVERSLRCSLEHTTGFCLKPLIAEAARLPEPSLAHSPSARADGEVVSGARGHEGTPPKIVPERLRARLRCDATALPIGRGGAEPHCCVQVGRTTHHVRDG